jgi:hypothetical protein
MGIANKLHGKKMNGKEVMKLRFLLTSIEDETGKVTEQKQRDIIAAKVTQVRNAIPEKINSIHSIRLKRINNELETQWDLIKKENKQSIDGVIKVLDQLINLFSFN